jgi:Thioredoxin domain
MNRIVIIGTDPPCPRCGLLFKVFSQKILELKLDAEVVHWTYTEEEAKEFAASIGLISGTAKDVSARINKGINHSKIRKILMNESLKENLEFKEYNDCSWSFELDELLRPFEMKSKEAGIMMTPVIVINGEHKHQGSVPEIKKIDKWLAEISGI